MNYPLERTVIREQAARVITGHREMDVLHKSMYSHDPETYHQVDEKKKLRADGLCLGLADLALTFAEQLPALLDALDAAKAMRERIRQEDGGADEWGRWYECAAFDDALKSLEGGEGE